MGVISFNLTDSLEEQFRGLVLKSNRDGVSDFMRHQVEEWIDIDRYGKKQTVNLDRLFEKLPLSKMAGSPVRYGNTLYVLLALEKISNQIDELIKSNKKKRG